MLPVQILKKTVCDIQNITGTECSVWNVYGNCLAYSKEVEEGLSVFIQKMPQEEEWEENNVSFFCVYLEEELIYILTLHSTSEEMKMAGRLGVKQLEGYLQLYQEKMNRNHFIQNLLLDNLLLIDVYNRAKKMHIPIEARRAVVVIEPKNPKDNLILEVMKGLYETSTKDFVTAVDEGHIILVKMLEEREGYLELNKIAKDIVDILNTEAMVNVRIGYGTIVDEIKDVSKSYKEAGMALDVGRIFYEEKNILAYNQLGIGRLIHQLPISLCDMFLTEIFEGKEMEFDEETLTTVHKFFENNLNISETARQLFLHRNTLVYRLEKIQKKTGLDVRIFDDALTFKIALMVSNHLKSLQRTVLTNTKEEKKW
ncbi:PucR family transcriptional regulator [Faecalimonas sp.]